MNSKDTCNYRGIAQMFFSLPKKAKSLIVWSQKCYSKPIKDAWEGDTASILRRLLKAWDYNYCLAIFKVGVPPENVKYCSFKKKKKRKLYLNIALGYLKRWGEKLTFPFSRSINEGKISIQKVIPDV